MPMVKRDGEFSKRKRTMTHRDSGFIINQGRLVFLFYKKLQNSDVSNLSRIRSAETHLPRLADDASIILPVIDMDGVGAWSFKFRYWPNNESRMYVFEGTGRFTHKYGLQTGDYILIYKDIVNWNYMIRGVKASEVEACANKEVSADDVVPNDGGALDLPVESVAGTSSVNDDISDILKSLSSWDEIEDYYYPPTPPNVTSDNLSGGDLSQVK
ncbi:hypothetical protein L1987_34586 [Smallanthus sonchifolius]|uniref:Uncharacterized protein n=1 Tax=Smallanthus sonchifolius TaxID=185202 RepID=A0ACB9HVG2_9ASTR|nr:hypothetical protein L1987_34586 [Smallanthus sonchifolius]